MSPATSVRIIDRLLDFWNSGNPDLAAQLYSADAERLDPVGGAIHGPQPLAQFANSIRRAFGGFRLVITESYVDEDLLAAFWTCSGFHEGRFLDVPPGGKFVEVTGVSLLRIRDERIVEDHTWFDSLKLLEQLRAGSLALLPRAS